MFTMKVEISDWERALAFSGGRSRSSLLHGAENTVVLIRCDLLRAQRQRHVSGSGVRPFDAQHPQAPGRSVDRDVERHLHGKRIGHLRLGERYVQDGLALAAVLEVVAEVVMRSFRPVYPLLEKPTHRLAEVLLDHATEVLRGRVLRRIC